MKEFFKFMFASMAGFILSMFILVFLLFSFVAMLVSMAGTEDVVVDNKSILHLKFDYDIPDRTPKTPFSLSPFGDLKPVTGLNDIIKSIEAAKNDVRIKGIYLDFNDIPAGFATVEEIRTTLDDFKQTGKFIFAYGNIYSQKAYYLATVADKIFVVPEGFIDFHGLNSQTYFLKGLLDKLDINVQIIRHGKFKSAVEPFMLDKMSEASKEQTLKFVSSIWNDILNTISGARDIPVSKLNELADGLLVQTTSDAYKYGLVDSVIFKDQFLDILANELNVPAVRKENLISLNKYRRAVNIHHRSRNKIAVIYASGNIVAGSAENNIGSEDFGRAIRNARLDNSVKAIVLRVNSPGGDGLASDIILREVNLAKKVKPVVVSMGNLAASGGYYISCGASHIFANPVTITGSIGVFGIIPDFGNFFKNKLGITFDGIKTNKNSDYMSVTKPLSSYQRNVIQDMVNRFYNTFINRVADGRGLTVQYVDSIGQGRVWSGRDAVTLGLADELGGLNAAVEKARQLAGLDEYRIYELPKLKDPLEQMLQDIMGQTRISAMKEELGEFYGLYDYLKSVEEMKGVQARLPYLIEVN